MSSAHLTTFKVASDTVRYTPTAIESTYSYDTASVTTSKGADGALHVTATPTKQQLHFRTQTAVPKVGLMMVGWGGNNGSTVTAAVLANSRNIAWTTKGGVQTPNYFGSITQSSTMRIGHTHRGDEVFVPLKSVVPLVSPNDLVLGGWDCSNFNLAEAMKRGAVLDYDLQRQLVPLMEPMKPLPAIFDLDFIAANQDDRANNVIPGTKAQAVEVVRGHIRDFKCAHSLDKIVVVWTANTERWSDVIPGIHDTADNLLAALARGEKEIAPSACYAMAAIQEGCAYINGAPQNTFVPGLVQLAERHNVFIGGDDFKSGQTKMKSALVEFFVAAGIKPESIASYNHLGNNDGRNLASPKQFRSKEISKSGVVEDMVASNSILYPDGKGPDHCIVIKYLPYVGDSKRALDEYIFSIFMGGQQCVVMHNTCEDSLLAAPLILDLCILTELMQRVTISQDGGHSYEHVRCVLSILSYLLKAPFVPAGTPIVNALGRQKGCIENLLRAMVGLPAENHLLLESKLRVRKP